MGVRAVVEIVFGFEVSEEERNTPKLDKLGERLSRKSKPGSVDMTWVTGEGVVNPATVIYWTASRTEVVYEYDVHHPVLNLKKYANQPEPEGAVEGLKAFCEKEGVAYFDADWILVSDVS